MKTTTRNFGFACALAPVLTFFGCTSINQATLDGIQGSMSQPVVEAYIEYPGPQQKWAGPASFILHVTAQDAGPAQIAVAPVSLTGRTGRSLASTPSSITVTGDTARTQLSNLAVTVQGSEESYRGCLSPVRLRLLRADGSVVERQGCRSSGGWPRIASETVSYFVGTVAAPAATAAVERTPAERSPASAKPAGRKTPPAKQSGTRKKNI